MQAQAPAQPRIPPYAVDIERVGLRRVHRDVEIDVLALVDAGRRRVPFDLLIDVVGQLRPPPAAGTGLLVLDDDGIALGDRRGRRYRDFYAHEEADSLQDGADVPALPHRPFS